MKNILVITGSPRKGGNTSLLADAFIRGAEEAGHSVSRFDAGSKKITGCIDCRKCYSKGGACVFGDDFNELAPMLEEAGTVVFVTPMYWFTFPAQIKAAIDKMYALLIGRKGLKGTKESLLIACATAADEAEYDGIVGTHRIMCEYLRWRNAGYMLAPGVTEPGDVLSTGALARAEKMGRNI